jgi:hypothetical protein
MWIKEVVLITVKVYERWQICKRIEWEYFINWFLMIEFCIIVIIALCFCFLLRENDKMGVQTIKVYKSKNRTAEYYLAYYSLFVLALIEFSLIEIVDVISLCLLLVLLGIVYIRNGLYYLNPTVSIIKSFIYEVRYNTETTDNSKITSKIVISKEKIYNKDVVEIYYSEFDFTLMKKKTPA